MKLLNYEWKDKFSLVKAKLECDCGHVFTVIVLDPDDTVKCPKCGRKFKTRVEYKSWGSQDEKYIDKLKEINPDRIIIIGGEFAVLRAFEIGNFERYGGQNRFETAQIILREFFNITLNTTNNILYIFLIAK